MKLKNNLRNLRNNIYCLPWKILSKVGLYHENQLPIQFVVEDANWAIKSVGINIKREIDIISPDMMEIKTDPSRLVKRIVHF